MTNTSDADIQYPGIEIISEHDGVTTGSPYNAFFVLFAKQSNELGVDFAADAAIMLGTVVTFKATLHSINDVSCTNLPGLSFTATVQ